MVNVNSDPEVTGGHHCVCPTQKVPLLLHAPSTSYYSISLCTRQKPLQELGTGRVKCALVGWEPQVCEALTSGVEITEGVGTG